MSDAFNGNGGGNGAAGVIHELKKKPAPPPSSLPDAAEKQVVFRSADGLILRGVLLRMQRHLAFFELYDPVAAPRVSEAFDDFKIILRERMVYAGRAVIRNVMNAGVKTVCEATLHEDAWIEIVSPAMEANAAGNPGQDFKRFLQEWQKNYLVTKEYKVVIADLQSFLADLRLWLDHLELGITASSAGERARLEAEIAHSLRDGVIDALSSLFERFEMVSNSLAEDLRPAHYAFSKRQLHPFLLCSPFLHRTYAKPLGYAGDYEMMNMIVRNSMEGESLFAKLINAYLLNHGPCRAVRNRANFLTTKIGGEVARVARSGQPTNIFCVACGPAWEAVDFIAANPLADQAQFSLLDFNEETLRYTSGKMDEVRRRHQRKTPVRFIKNSVQNLLRAKGRATKGENSFDLIYCSGLYDYLSDSVCVALNSHLYDLLQPGGLMVIGNFATHTPGQNLMEHLMEWFLIYRNHRQLLATAPVQAAKDDCVVRSEPTGANIFLEVRKPT